MTKILNKPVNSNKYNRRLFTLTHNAKNNPLFYNSIQRLAASVIKEPLKINQISYALYQMKLLRDKEKGFFVRDSIPKEQTTFIDDLFK